MTRDAMYGGALIAGALAGMTTMLLHPTGSQLIADVQHVAPMGIAVHALALAALPVSFFGAIGLTRTLGGDGDASLAALAAFGMASVAVMIAAVASGLLAPALAAQMVATTGADHDFAKAFFQYTGMINQAFAKVYVVAASAAMLLWSWSILAHGRLARAAGVYGVIAGILALLAVSIGHLRLDVHGFGAVVLIEGVWFIAIGILLARARPAASTAR